MPRTFTCPTSEGSLELELHEDHVEVRLRKGKKEKVVRLFVADVFEEVDNFLAGHLRKPNDDIRHRDHFLLSVDEKDQPVVRIYERWEFFDDHFDVATLRPVALDFREAVLAQSEALMDKEGGDAWGILWTLSLDPVGNVRMAEMEETATKWLHKEHEWHDEKHIRPFSLDTRELYGYMDMLGHIGVIDIHHDWGYWYSATRLGRALLARRNLNERVELWQREAIRRTRRWEAVTREWDERRTQRFAAQHPDGWRVAIATVKNEEFAIVVRRDGTFELNDSSNGFSGDILVHGKSLGDVLRTQLAKDPTWIEVRVKVEKAPLPIRRSQHYQATEPGQEPQALRGDVAFVQLPPELGAGTTLVHEAGSVRGRAQGSQWEETYYIPIEGEPHAGEWLVRRSLRDWSARPPTHDVRWAVCPASEVPEDVLAPFEGRAADPARCFMLESLKLRKLTAGAAQVRSLEEGDTMGILPKKGTAVEAYPQGEVVIVKSSVSSALGTVIGVDPASETTVARLRLKGVPRRVPHGMPPHAAFGESTAPE